MNSCVSRTPDTQARNCRNTGRARGHGSATISHTAGGDLAKESSQDTLSSPSFYLRAVFR